MHADQVDVDEELVARLLVEQFPDWAELPLAPVPEQGTDHALYRLGTELVVRMPVIAWADGQAAREAEWLPRLAPHLPVELSVPRALGEPGPKAAGGAETFTVFGLDPGATYYFALKVRDEMGNESDLSNVAAATVGPARAVFADDMEHGPNGWAATGLWHQSTLRSYSPATSWYYGQEATRTYDTGAVNAGCMFVFGGEGERTHVLGLTPTAYGYHPRADRWTRLPDLPIAVHGLKGSAVIGGRIFLPGGGITLGGNSGTNAMQVYRPTMHCE